MPHKHSAMEGESLHRRSNAEDDTEGHLHRRSNSEDDVEGHLSRRT